MFDSTRRDNLIGEYVSLGLTALISGVFLGGLFYGLKEAPSKNYVDKTTFCDYSDTNGIVCETIPTTLSRVVREVCKFSAKDGFVCEDFPKTDDELVEFCDESGEKEVCQEIPGSLEEVAMNYCDFSAESGFVCVDNPNVPKQVIRVCEDFSQKHDLECQVFPEVELVANKEDMHFGIIYASGAYFSGEMKVKLLGSRIGEVNPIVTRHEMGHAVMDQIVRDSTGMTFPSWEYLGIINEAKNLEILGEYISSFDKLGKIENPTIDPKATELREKIKTMEIENETLLTQVYVMDLISEGVASYLEVEDRRYDFWNSYFVPDHLHEIDPLYQAQDSYSYGLNLVGPAMNVDAKKTMEWFANNPPTEVQTLKDAKTYFQRAKDEVTIMASASKLMKKENDVNCYDERSSGEFVWNFFKNGNQEFVSEVGERE